MPHNKGRLVNASFLKTPAGRAGLATAITVAAAGLAMLVMGARAYDWVKAVHVIAVISWMAGLLYLPRLFVYHAELGPGTHAIAPQDVIDVGGSSFQVIEIE